jgi:hypothetical protein
MGKGDTDRGHSRENYDHIFRKEECECEECREEDYYDRKVTRAVEAYDITMRKREYAKRVTEFKGDKHNAM